MNPFIQLYSGKRFYFLDPDPDDIELEDIAHALSHLCRYNGHAHRFYSVAEHSVHVLNCRRAMGHFSQGELQAALLHDAAEAFVGDVTKPLKMLLGPAYADIEARAHAAVQNRFGLPDQSSEIHMADRIMAGTEMPQVVNYRGSIGGAGEPLPPALDPSPIGFWDPGIARTEFLWEAQNLGLR